MTIPLVIFVHIPKTAGTSVSAVLRSGIPSDRVRWLTHPVQCAAKLAEMPMAERVDCDMIEGHFYFGLHELLHRPCAYVTMLRDPVERVLSYYSYVRGRADHYLHASRDTSLPLSEWIKRGYTIELENFQTRSLAGMHRIGVPFGAVNEEMLAEACGHLDTFAWVGITERFDESVALLRTIMGWPAEEQSANPRRNVTQERVKREQTDPQTLELIRHHNRLDAQLYEHGTRLLAARLGERPPRCYPPTLAQAWSLLPADQG